MAVKVSLSFKNEEKYIYDYLMTKLSPSIYLKELILKDMENHKEKKRPLNYLSF